MIMTRHKQRTLTTRNTGARPAGRKHNVLRCAECFLTSARPSGKLSTNNRDLKQQISHDYEPGDTERNQSGQKDATLSALQSADGQEQDTPRVSLRRKTVTNVWFSCLRTLMRRIPGKPRQTIEHHTAS